jgi:uncharacterized metal-binding protein YceD (DUF177 family)
LKKSLHLRANYRSLKSLKTYSIPFTGLKLGKHLFEYAITDAFFEELDYSLVKKADLQCKVELDKQETMLILTFDIAGTIGLTCDKCLSQYPQQVNIHEQQIAKFGEEEIDEDEEIITLRKNDFEINVAGLIYEYVTVAVPFFARCNDEGNTPYCDKEMLERLNKLASGESETTNEQHDPRWDALKKFK